MSLGDINANVNVSGGSGFVDLGVAVINLITTLQQEANGPDAIKAAQAKEKLAQFDELATAQANNDIETERKFLERRMQQIQQGN